MEWETYRLLSRSFSSLSTFSLARCAAFSNDFAPSLTVALCVSIAIGCSSLDDALSRTTSECGGSGLRLRECETPPMRIA